MYGRFELSVVHVRSRETNGLCAGAGYTGRNRYAIITLYLLNSYPLSGGVFIELALSDYTSESLH
jgi:hypothetical protein